MVNLQMRITTINVIKPIKMNPEVVSVEAVEGNFIITEVAFLHKKTVVVKIWQSSKLEVSEEVELTVVINSVRDKEES